jgi:predicted SnoaL-like aldol condensation-catalyzing enzyme
MTAADLVRTFTEQFKNRSNFDIVDEICAENFVHHLPIPGLPSGRRWHEGRRTRRDRRDPRHQVSIEILVTDGDYVANRNNARGMRADNGEAINWIEHEIWRTDNGRLAEAWSVARGLDIG